MIRDQLRLRSEDPILVRERRCRRRHRGSPGCFESEGGSDGGARVGEAVLMDSQNNWGSVAAFC